MATNKHAKRFFSIDDDRTLQLIVKQILTKSFGLQALEVFQAGTGEEGLQTMREIKPDIILCDIHMPGMNGEYSSLIKRFQCLSPESKSPFDRGQTHSIYEKNA